LIFWRYVHEPRSLSDPPIAEISATNLVTRGIRHDKFGPRITAKDNRVLPKGSAKVDCLVSFNAVNEPSGFAPSSIWLVVQTNATFNSVAPENQQIAQHLVTLLVDFTRQQH